MPKAFPRSAGLANDTTRMDTAAGARAAADTPCTARAASSGPAELVSPTAREDAVNSSSPDRNICRRPNTSASLPPSSSRPPKNST